MNVTLDLASKQISGSVSPLGSPPASPVSSTLSFPSGDLTSVAVGLFVTTASTGVYWLDDFSLE